MPNSTEKDQQQKRRRDAWQSVIVASGLLVFQATVLLLLRQYFLVEGFWSTILLIVSLLELGMLIPVWITLKLRLKEIEGGEEYAAAQY